MLKLDNRFRVMTDHQNQGNHEKIEKSSQADSTKAEKVDVQGTANIITHQAEMAGRVGEVADFGVESSESTEGEKGFGEQEDTTKGKTATGVAQTTNTDEIKTHIPAAVPEVQMRREVAHEIRQEIRREERKVLLAYVGIKKMPPNKLAEIVARIRSLRDILAGLIDATKEILVGLYMKWVRKEG